MGRFSCQQCESSVPAPSATGWQRLWTALAGISLLLAPKCPLCILAWAAATGVGVAGAYWLYRLAPTVIATLVFAAFSVSLRKRPFGRPDLWVTLGAAGVAASKYSDLPAVFYLGFAALILIGATLIWKRHHARRTVQH